MCGAFEARAYMNIWSILQATEAPKERENWFQDFFPPPITYEYGQFTLGSQGFLYKFFVAWQSAGAWQI